jgi:hypothetical protein
MRFQQIAVATDSENGEILYGLTESGTLYERHGRYVAAERAENGAVLKQAYTVYWWEEMDYPVGDPTAELPVPLTPVPLVPQEPEIRHLWTDEEVEKLKAKGVISTEPFTEAIPASTPGTCVYCNTPTGDESSVCKDCEFPF